MSLTVRLKPPTNAQYAACSSTTAILIKTSIWLIHSKTFSSSYVSLNFSVRTAPPRYLCSSLVVLILVTENILIVRLDGYVLTTSRVFIVSG